MMDMRRIQIVLTLALIFGLCLSDVPSKYVLGSGDAEAAAGAAKKTVVKTKKKLPKPNGKEITGKMEDVGPGGDEGPGGNSGGNKNDNKDNKDNGKGGEGSGGNKGGGNKGGNKPGGNDWKPGDRKPDGTYGDYDSFKERNSPTRDVNNNGIPDREEKDNCRKQPGDRNYAGYNKGG